VENPHSGESLAFPIRGLKKESGCKEAPIDTCYAQQVMCLGRRSAMVANEVKTAFPWYQKGQAKKVRRTPASP